MDARSGSRQSGLTILESLVAVAIVSIVMVSLLASLAKLQDQRIRASQIERASVLAARIVAEAELKGPDNLPGGTGQFPEPDQDMQWSLEVKNGPADPDLPLLTVKVTWGTKEINQVTLSRLLVRP
ncbi:type IV pilus modification PilV family protein [Fundidesulfovibrio soli]|uniref:type IV pilus modification PilV family protein n=1 Tax=Fundidesulfovibrio soli TaxID=2922716 RepID=UPI001FAE8115|nr:type II secretion system protein [Fundidesulfovibrio soli]